MTVFEKESFFSMFNEKFKLILKNTQKNSFLNKDQKIHFFLLIQNKMNQNIIQTSPISLKNSLICKNKKKIKSEIFNDNQTILNSKEAIQT